MKVLYPSSFKFRLNFTPEELAKYEAALEVLDFVFACIIVTPLSVLYYKSLFALMDFYIFPDRVVESALVSWLFGLGGLFFMLFQKGLASCKKIKSRIVYTVVVRVYLAVYAFSCVNSWRGLWSLQDSFITTNLYPVLGTTALGVFGLAFLKSLRNISASPTIIGIDFVPNCFEVPTRFKTIGKKTSLYILDCLFSVLVVGTLVVFVWRGAWILLDILLFPEDFTGSSWASLIIGYVAVAIAFVIQPLMRWICDRLTGIARLIVADLFILFSFFGTVNVWRGIWNLLNIYFLPDNFELSCWITHWVSLVVLILLGCSNSLLIRGVYIDAEEPAGKCVVFPCYYLRIIFQQEKIKKLNAKQVLANQKINLSEKEERSEKLGLENNHMHCIDLKSELSENHK